jgi:hypothetical protein
MSLGLAIKLPLHVAEQARFELASGDARIGIFDLAFGSEY